MATVDTARKGTVAVAALRVAYGAALIAAPARTTASWIGPDARRSAAAIAIRALGAREVGVHLAALRAAASGAPARPWLAVSIAGDCVDIAATFAGRQSVPDHAPAATAAVAGVSAALSASLAFVLDA